MSAVHSQSPSVALIVISANNIYVCEENVELITVELSGVVVHSMYKPPPEPFRIPAFGQRNKPHIVIGHFKSHSTLWGYTNLWSNGRTQTASHSYTTQNYTTVQYGRRDTTRISYLYHQTFQICVRNLFWIPSRAHSIARLLCHNPPHPEYF